MRSVMQELTGIVTTDLAAITRGRFIMTDDLETTAATGVGWIQSNLSMTTFGNLADPNIWGSAGDLRLIPDVDARFRTPATGGAIPFDLMIGDLVETDGRPWEACPRQSLKRAVAHLQNVAGLRLKVSFEHEFYLMDHEAEHYHPLAFGELRRNADFAANLVAALNDAGLETANILAELGPGQIEVSIAPGDPVAAADRAVALREITRDLAFNLGRKVSFAPKPLAEHAGSGVHIHFSLINADGKPCTYQETGPAHLSSSAQQFCAGILRHLPALTAFTAPSPVSYHRLGPHRWSASYTWLAKQDREAALRVCPILAMSQAVPAEQMNIEYRAADATANPYLALAAIIHAGLAGIKGSYKLPALVATHPERLAEEERSRYALKQLPQSLEQAIAHLRKDAEACAWFPLPLLETYLAVKRSEVAVASSLDGDRLRAIYTHRY